MRRWSRTAGPQASAGSCVASGRVALRRLRPSAGRGCSKYAARDCVVRAWAVAGTHGCLCMLPRLRGASTPSISDSDLEMSASGRSFSELFMVPTFRSMVASGICRTARECAARRAVARRTCRPVRHGWAQGKGFFLGKGHDSIEIVWWPVIDKLARTELELDRLCIRICIR